MDQIVYELKEKRYRKNKFCGSRLILEILEHNKVKVRNKSNNKKVTFHMKKTKETTISYMFICHSRRRVAKIAVTNRDKNLGDICIGEISLWSFVLNKLIGHTNGNGHNFSSYNRNFYNKKDLVFWSIRFNLKDSFEFDILYFADV